MPEYVKTSLHQFNHKPPKMPQHQPYSAPERTYGEDSEKMKPIDTSTELPTERVERIECIIGKFSYYVRGINNTCLVLLNIMATISAPTEQDKKMNTNFWIK